MEAKGDRNPIIIFPMQQTPQILLPPPPPPLQSSHASITSFPILALTVLGILTTSVVLLTYYVFVVRCCLNWHHSDVVSLVARRHNRRGSSSNRPPATYMPSTEAEGLDESAIQALPAFRYRKVAHIKNMTAAATFNECAVCLSEFQEEEKIRLLPNCFHVFHVDCIDTWLQANAKCPLCRAAITTTSSCPFPVLDQFLRPEEVVIQVVSDTEESTQQQETSRGATSSADTDQEASKKRKNMFCHITSKGDECIGVRRVRDVPMRRSFSMDSLTKIGEVQLQVQKNLQKNPYINSDDSSSSTGPETPSFKQQHIGAILPI